MIYKEEPEIREEVMNAGGVKRVAHYLKWPPSRLSNKLNGWSPLFQEEREKIMKAIEDLSNIAPIE